MKVSKLGSSFFLCCSSWSKMIQESVDSALKTDKDSHSHKQNRSCISVAACTHPPSFRRVFSICVQRPVLWRQTLPPQPLNEPEQQRRERLFRTSAILRSDCILNQLGHGNFQKRHMTALTLALRLFFSLLCSPFFCCLSLSHLLFFSPPGSSLSIR